MRYHERLKIVFIRDNGPRRNFNVSRNRFHLFVLFFACLPFVCIILGVQCWRLTQHNNALADSLARLESANRQAELRAERLENLQTLLDEENIPASNLLVRNLAPATDPALAKPPAEVSEENEEGPGHEEFPVLDTGRVVVSNVQARAQRGNRLRIGLDLRNPENEQSLSGKVSVQLLSADGQSSDLVFSPREVGNFRISRFKRTVMTANVPRGTSLENSQIILEVTNQDGEPLYRNIYAVQQ